MITTLIPFYSGDNRLYDEGGQLGVEKCQDYLIRTIKSCHRFSDHIVVGCCQQQDLDFVSGLGPDVYAVNLPLDDPMQLPVKLCMYYQQQVISGSAPHDYIFFTEADQVLYGDPDRYFQLLDEKNCITAHRVEELYNGHGADRGPVFLYEDRSYVLVNIEQPVPGNTHSFRTRSAYEAYGANFLVHKTLMAGVPWTFHQQLPMEHASFDVYTYITHHNGSVLKTVNFSEFWVDHLSGYDRHKQSYDGTH